MNANQLLIVAILSLAIIQCTSKSPAKKKAKTTTTPKPPCGKCHSWGKYCGREVDKKCQQDAVYICTENDLNAHLIGNCPDVHKGSVCKGFRKQAMCDDGVEMREIEDKYKRVNLASTDEVLAAKLSEFNEMYKDGSTETPETTSDTVLKAEYD